VTTAFALVVTAASAVDRFRNRLPRKDSAQVQALHDALGHGAPGGAVDAQFGSPANIQDKE
jgi:hypothetical protein